MTQTHQYTTVEKYEANSGDAATVIWYTAPDYLELEELIQKYLDLVQAASAKVTTEPTPSHLERNVVLGEIVEDWDVPKFGICLNKKEVEACYRLQKFFNTHDVAEYVREHQILCEIPLVAYMILPYMLKLHRDLSAAGAKMGGRVPKYKVYEIHGYSPDGEYFSSFRYTVPTGVDFQGAVEGALEKFSDLSEKGRIPTIESSFLKDDLARKIQKGEPLGFYERMYTGYVLNGVDVVLVRRMNSLLREEKKGNLDLDYSFAQSWLPRSAAEIIEAFMGVDLVYSHSRLSESKPAVKNNPNTSKTKGKE